MKTAGELSAGEVRLGAGAAGLTRTAQLVGLAGLAGAVILGQFDRESFLRAYVLNYCFLLSIVLGALFFVMLQHLTRAGWSVVVRRIAEVVTTALPLLALLALPIVGAVVLGWPAEIARVYPWTDGALVHPPAGAPHEPDSALLAHKAPYLNPTFFTLRIALYFAVWILLARYLFSRSTRQDDTGDPQLTLDMARTSAPGMLLFALTLTFAAVDLLMALAPTWFSTIFGVYYFAGSVLGFMSVLALAMFTLQRAGRLRTAISVEHYHDVGKLMFAFVVFWSYIAFSQYMLYWYANMPEETSWFLVRQTGGWLYLSLALLFCHFMIPFLALISRGPKRRPEALAAGAVWVLAVHWLDMFYLAMPPYFFTLVRDGFVNDDRLRDAPFPVIGAGLALLLLIGLGGLVLSAVVSRMSRHPLVPERDPRLHESLAFENF